MLYMMRGGIARTLNVHVPQLAAVFRLLETALVHTGAVLSADVSGAHDYRSRTDFFKLMSFGAGIPEDVGDYFTRRPKRERQTHDGVDQTRVELYISVNYVLSLNFHRKNGAFNGDIEVRFWCQSWNADSTATSNPFPLDIIETRN